MAKNLEKRKNIKVNKITDEDFADINLNNIRNNKQIFIPYAELPDSDEQRSYYLESLIAFIKRETGIICSYLLVNEIEPYEINGYYIQTVPELRDCHGKYVENDDDVYDKDNVKWHVSYYFENNAPHIILDNENGNYQIVKSLSGFSSISGDFSEPEDDISVEKRNDNNCRISSGVIIAAESVAFLTLIIVILVLFLKAPDFISNIKEDPIQFGEKIFLVIIALIPLKAMISFFSKLM